MTTPRLDTRIPEQGFPDADAMLGAFLDWVAQQGLALYRHQEDAILEIFSGKHVVLDAPTGSGKSLVATALHFKSFAEARPTWYTAPTKALVSEKFFALCDLFGAEFVGMLTGDGAVNRDAPILCATTEILANLALREGARALVASVVMDEFHFYADRDRGWAWQVPLLTLPQATFLLMSATLGDTTAIREDLERRTGRPVAEVRGVHRPVPLEYAWSMDPIHEALQSLVARERWPVYAVHFTQAEASEQAQALMSTDWCTREEKRALAEAVRDVRFHSPFGPTLKRTLLHGIGLHHAGLLPRYRLLVERLAQMGRLKVICGTDTLGVGINVPIRTVLITRLCKFDGTKTRILEAREFHQITGRAGRAGYDDRGWVVVQAPAHVIQNARIDAMADERKKRRTVRAQPPAHNYKPWDEATFHRLVASRPEPLESRFTVDHGRLLAVLQKAADEGGDARPGVDALHRLVDESHAAKAEKARLHARTDDLLEDLLAAGVARRDHERLLLDAGLQRDFSLHHSLSLYLLDALGTLDRESESYSLDVLTRVEAILEDPRPVLQRQVDVARTALLQALKAAGVPYEDRIAALDEVTWPQPDADALWAHFHAYARTRPWVVRGAIRPKSVARAMAESFTSFADYVRDLGVQRSEGVLLRYLSEVYRGLVENVPSSMYTDALVDLVAWLRALLAVVDESLLHEWERRVGGTDAPRLVERPVDISADRRAFAARIRAEFHAVVRALSREDWEEAAACLKRGEDDPWNVEAIAAALEPFLEEYGAVGFDHRARLATHTRIVPDGPHRWTVRQRLLPPVAVDPTARVDEDLGAWALLGRVDLREDTHPEGPVVQLLDVER
ncbi:MAG: DUF3516 domain-containing protein [Deltaproteobacteria bacterium]|nr:DUF3516 domain-containing protein [Deltaproteobacteria bacterium]